MEVQENAISFIRRSSTVSTVHAQQFYCNCFCENFWPVLLLREISINSGCKHITNGIDPLKTHVFLKRQQDVYHPESSIAIVYHPESSIAIEAVNLPAFIATMRWLSGCHWLAGVCMCDCTSTAIKVRGGKPWFEYVPVVMRACMRPCVRMMQSKYYWVRARFDASHVPMTSTGVVSQRYGVRLVTKKLCKWCRRLVHIPYTKCQVT